MSSWNKKRTIVRSISSRSCLFGNDIDDTRLLSRTFSLSSSEADDDDNDRFEDAVVVEGFDDEGISTALAGDKEGNIVQVGSSSSTNDAMGAAVPIAQTTIPPDLRVPREKFHVPRKALGFFMETMIRRDETKTRFIMYQQSTEEAHPIFCAQKYPPSEGGHILIKSLCKSNYNEDEDEDDHCLSHPNYNKNSTNTNTILGSLVKKKNKVNQNCEYSKNNKIIYTTYELLVHEPATTNSSSTSTTGSFQMTNPSPNNTNNAYYAPTEKKSSISPLVVATIDYEQVSKARYLFEGCSRPRCARVTILGKDGKSLRAAESRKPHQRSNGQKVLDFGGRGLQISSKNIQLVHRSFTDSAPSSSTDTGDDHDCCCLQMVKWKDNEFNLDFGSPFDAFHAFAFALAQFDF